MSAVLVAGCGGGTTATGPQDPVDEPSCCRVALEPVQSGEIRGEIVVQGAIDPRALVARLEGAAGVPPLEVRLGDAGRFFFGPVPPGDYELVIAAARGESLWRDRVSVGDGDSLMLTVEVPSAR